MTSWRQVRPVPRGDCTATHLPGCWGFFSRGSHHTSPLCHLQCPRGPGRARMPLPSSTSRARRSDCALPSGPKTTVPMGSALRRRGETQPARSWRSRPAWGREAAREVAGPRGAREARPGGLGQVTGLRAARGSPAPRAQHRHRGHLGREDGMARQPGQLGAPPAGAVGVRAHSGGRGLCAHWWSPRGTEVAPGHSRLGLWKRRSQASACAGGRRGEAMPRASRGPARPKGSEGPRWQGEAWAARGGVAGGLVRTPPRPPSSSSSSSSSSRRRGPRQASHLWPGVLAWAKRGWCGCTGDRTVGGSAWQAGRGGPGGPEEEERLP